MSSRINSFLNQLWSKFKDKSYRHAFASSWLATNIPAQIFSMREARGWTQKQLAEAAGMAQARISVMEDQSYDKFSLSTLRRLAMAFDAVVAVEFISFSELAKRACDPSPKRMAVPDFEHDELDHPIGQDRTATIPFTTAPIVYVLPGTNDVHPRAGQTMITNPGLVMAMDIGPASGARINER